MSSDDKKDDKTNRTTGETARRMLLAGIGAYGRAFMEAQEALKDVRGKSSDVFDELVQKGEMMEMAFEHKSKAVMEKASIPSVSIPSVSKASANLDERIKKMRSRLSRSGDDDDAVIARLDAVEAKLDKLLKAIEAQDAPTKKPKSKPKSSAKKSATTRTKPSQKTAPPKKPSAKS